MSKGTGDILLPVQTLNFSFTMTTSTERHMTCEEAGCVFTFYFKHIQRLKVSQILVMLPMAKWEPNELRLLSVCVFNFKCRSNTTSNPRPSHCELIVKDRHTAVDMTHDE